MDEGKNILIPFAVTLNSSTALNNSIGTGMPVVPPALIDKLDVVDGTADIYGDKKAGKKSN